MSVDVLRPTHTDTTTDVLLGDGDGWTVASNIYQDSMGQCTMQAARLIVSRLLELAPITPTSYILDNGTGGGSIVRILAASHPDVRILATDLSRGMLTTLSSAHLPNVETRLADAVDLAAILDHAFTHVTTSFMLQFVSDPTAALGAMYRVLAPGGTAVVAIWGPRADLSIVNDRAAHAALPTFKPRPYYGKTAWSEEDRHGEELRAAGFTDVGTESFLVDFPTPNAKEFVKYWFESGNPVNKTHIGEFTAQGGDEGKCRIELEKIVREDYDDGKDLKMEVVLGWGRK